MRVFVTGNNRWGYGSLPDGSGANLEESRQVLRRQGQLQRVLDELHSVRGPITSIAVGQLAGPGKLAMNWAQRNGVDYQDFSRRTQVEGDLKAAIFLAIFHNFTPDLIVIFPGKMSFYDYLEALAERFSVPIQKVRQPPAGASPKSKRTAKRIGLSHLTGVARPPAS